MKRFFIALVAVLMTIGVWAQEEPAPNKYAFTVKGPERTYNQIRVVNHTSHVGFQCRVVFLNDDDSFMTLYGIYNLKGVDDTDSNSQEVRRGDRVGVQLAKDFPGEVTFSVEYRDYPFYDAILIHIYDKTSGFDEEF